jgi:hypothetical protein
MAVTVRARDKDELARFLGWFSVGLGSTQLAAPRALCRLIGADADGLAPKVMRLMGARELTQGIGILARARPTTWMWSRVAGDALDVSLVALTAVRNPGRRARAAFALANLVPVAIADVFESRHLTAKRGTPVGDRRIRKAVTLQGSRADVEKAWLAADELRARVVDGGGSVHIREVPGGRGIELAVEFRERAPLGDLGAAAMKLTGNDLATELADGLRRFKQVFETGEVVRSDSTPDGHLLASHLKQRPAQPLEEVTR